MNEEFCNHTWYTIRSMCDCLKKKWDAIPKESDHSAVIASIQKSFDMLSAKVSEKYPDSVCVCAGFDPNNSSKLYIAYIDVAYMAEVMSDEMAIRDAEYPVVYVEVKYIDFNDDNNHDSGLVEALSVEEPDTAFANIIKSLQPMYAVVFAAYCIECAKICEPIPKTRDDIPYSFNFVAKRPNLPTFISKTVVTLNGISSTFTVINKYPDYSKCVGCDIDGAIANNAGSEYDLLNKFVDIARFFNSLVITDALDMDCDESVQGIDEHKIRKHHSGPVIFKVSGTEYACTNITLHYDDVTTAVDMETYALVKYPIV